VQAAETRQRLIDAAVELFSENSYDDVAVGDIARAAGVAHGLLFHYFGSKRRIYLEAVRAAADVLNTSFAPRPGLAPGHQLREALVGHFRYLAAHPGLALRLVLSGRGADQEAWEVFEASRMRAVEWISRLLGLDADVPAVRMMWRAAVGAIDETAVCWLQSGQQFDVDAVVESVVEVAAAALKAATRLDPGLDIDDVITRMLHPDTAG
jgi:AcrR family transcriptional regulator